MCGRYALSIRATFVRYQLEDHGMPVDDEPQDEDYRQTYNFAPGHIGLVYRADVPAQGAGYNEHAVEDHPATQALKQAGDGAPNKPTKYKLQAMKWGLIPFWTKRNPGYGSVLKTINARDDSLAENKGMWNSMKKTKRCIIVAEGFYEWLKKNGGREKVPHYTKRKDGKLMLFAGLWDCAKYEGSDEEHWTYTIITTDSNPQLRFLHDRMPVILDNATGAVRTWLDPQRREWSRELQSLLKPYQGELECYTVNKDVGKVGNNSPSFIVPVASSENKNNIANFFSNAGKAKDEGTKHESDIKKEAEGGERQAPNDHDQQDGRETIDASGSEDNAPMPVPSNAITDRKRENEEILRKSPARKIAKSEAPSRDATEGLTSRKLRSSTTNGTGPGKNPLRGREGSQKITDFFAK